MTIRQELKTLCLQAVFMLNLKLIKILLFNISTSDILNGISTVGTWKSFGSLRALVHTVGLFSYIHVNSFFHSGAHTPQRSCFKWDIAELQKPSLIGYRNVLFFGPV